MLQANSFICIEKNIQGICMKSKIAMLVCLTQLCMLGHYPLNAATKSFQTKKSRKSKQLLKKASTSLGIIALGTFIALYAKHKNNLAREDRLQNDASFTPRFKITYSGWQMHNSAGACTPMTVNYCNGIDESTFLQGVDLNAWRQVLGLQPSDDPSILIRNAYRNTFIIPYNPNNVGLEFMYLKKNLSFDQTLMDIELLNKSSNQAQFLFSISAM